MLSVGLALRSFSGFVAAGGKVCARVLDRVALLAPGWDPSEHSPVPRREAPARLPPVAPRGEGCSRLGHRGSRRAQLGREPGGPDSCLLPWSQVSDANWRVNCARCCWDAFREFGSVSLLGAQCWKRDGRGGMQAFWLLGAALKQTVRAKHTVLHPALHKSAVCFLSRSASCMGAVPDPDMVPATFALASQAGLFLLERSFSVAELSWEDKEDRGVSVGLLFARGRGAAGVAGGLKSCFLCWLPPC